jgi:hypothetical protein
LFIRSTRVASISYAMTRVFGAPLREASDVVAMRRADYDNCGGRVLDDVFNDRVEALFVSSQHFPITPTPPLRGQRRPANGPASTCHAYPTLWRPLGT